MALRARQTRFYTDRCSIYRRNKTKSANGDFTYSLLASGVACKHYTEANYDNDGVAGGFAQAKESNIFTSDVLHVDAAQDIASEDYILMTTSPNTASKMTWFVVSGEPITRGGVANYSAVFMIPTPAPEIV